MKKKPEKDNNELKSPSIKTKKPPSPYEHKSLLNFLANLNTLITEQANNNYINTLEYAKELHNYYESIIACMPNNVYWLDRNCVLLGGNDNLARMFGLKSHAELVGLTYEQMSKLANWTEGQGESFRNAELEVMSTGIPRFNVDEPPVIIDGKTRYYISSKVPLYNLKREIIGVVGISVDITERKNLEAALRKAKTEFLENMRHDIRTPLTGITSLANMIREQVNDPKIKQYADTLSTSSHALLDLLNEILEAIKVNSGEIPLLKKKFNLKKRLHEVIKLNQARASQKDIELIFSYDDQIPPYVVGDSTRIHRITLELIANALNFTETGSVKLKATLADQNERELIIKLIVEDTGIGIDPSKQQDIFLQFKRLTPSYEGIYKGAGLGLAIVKQFLDELEGEIYVESQVGIGSRFTCVIPIKKSLLDEEFGSDDLIAETATRTYPPFAEPAKHPVLTTTLSTTCHILLVEDQDIAALAASTMLSALGCAIDIAVDGKTAIKLAQDNHYDLIFMDIGLPDIDGYEVTRRMRLHELTKAVHVPVIALTAHVDDENKQSCIEAGINAVYSKPLSKEKAEYILNAFIPYRTYQEDTAKPAQEDIQLLNIKGKIIDFEQAQQLLGGKSELVEEMLMMLVSSFAQELFNLKAAYLEKNWTTIKEIAHKLRGGSTYCGTARLKEVCGKLEDSVRAEKKELYEALYHQLLFEIKAIEEAVKNKSYME